MGMKGLLRTQTSPTTCGIRTMIEIGAHLSLKLRNSLLALCSSGEEEIGCRISHVKHSEDPGHRVDYQMFPNSSVPTDYAATCSECSSPPSSRLNTFGTNPGMCSVCNSGFARFNLSGIEKAFFSMFLLAAKF